MNKYDKELKKARKEVWAAARYTAVSATTKAAVKAAVRAAARAAESAAGRVAASAAKSAARDAAWTAASAEELEYQVNRVLTELNKEN